MEFLILATSLIGQTTYQDREAPQDMLLNIDYAACSAQCPVSNDQMIMIRLGHTSQPTAMY
jgi:hypothetical protein